MSPITNMGSDDATGLVNPEQLGMDFTNMLKSQTTTAGTLQSQALIEGSLPSNNYTGSVGPLIGDASKILKSVRIFHVYDGGRQMNVFQFLNPRITEMTLDDLDMSTSEGNEVNIKFNYDSVYIHTGIPANQSPFTDNASALPGQQTGALYPLRYNGSAGAMNAAHANVAAYGSQGATTSCDPLNSTNTSSNPFIVGGGIGGALDSLGSIGTQITGSAGDIVSGLFS